MIAPDLIAQRDSEKLLVSEGPGRYFFKVVNDYLEGLLGAIGAN